MRAITITASGMTTAGLNVTSEAADIWSVEYHATAEKTSSRIAPRTAFFQPLGLLDESPIIASAVMKSMAISRRNVKRFHPSVPESSSS